MWPTAWRKQPFIKHSSVYYCLFWGSDWLKTQVKVQKCPAYTPPARVLIGPRESRGGQGLNSSNLRPWSLQSSPEPTESKTNIYFKVLQLRNIVLGFYCERTVLGFYCERAQREVHVKPILQRYVSVKRRRQQSLVKHASFSLCSNADAKDYKHTWPLTPNLSSQK